MKSKSVYPAKQDGEKWAVIDMIMEINGCRTKHPEDAGLKFQLKQLEFWRDYYQKKYNHKVFIYYSEVND